MAGSNDRQPGTDVTSTPSAAPAIFHDRHESSLAADPLRPDPDVASKASASTGNAEQPPKPGPAAERGRRVTLVIAILVVLGVGGWLLVPWVMTALNTVSTDDAYVNSHLTFLAARVPGQVLKVMVDDNYRVKEGDVLVEIDPEPYRVQVAIQKAAVDVAATNLDAAEAQVRAQLAQTRANRYKLQHAIEEVDDQVANLHAAVATLDSRKASLKLAAANLERGVKLVPSNAVSSQEIDVLRESVTVDEATVQQALQEVYALRVNLGLPAQPQSGQALDHVPPDLDQNFSTVREALADLQQSAAQVGYFPASWTATPKQAIEQFYKQAPNGNVNEIFAQLIPRARPSSRRRPTSSRPAATWIKPS